MRQFEESHPQFFHDYHHARAVVDFPVIPRERRDAARKRIADRKAEVAQRRDARRARAQLRKNAPASAGASSESAALSN